MIECHTDSFGDVGRENRGDFSESSCVMMIMRSLEPNLLDRSRSASSEAVQPLFDEWKNTRYERSAAAGFRDASQVTLLSSGARSPMTMFCAWDAPNVQNDSKE